MAKQNPNPIPPWSVGDAVAVIRHEHGWEDGCIEGVVTKAEQRPTGSWKYVVRVGGHGKKGYDLDIPKTNDLRRAHG